MTATAFTTSAPDTVAAYLTAQDAVSAFGRAVRAAAVELGRNTGPLSHLSKFTGELSTVGLSPDDPDDPPAGWVYSKRNKCLLPRRGTTVGEAAQRWLNAHQPPPGVQPRTVLRGHGLPLNDILPGCQVGLPTIGHYGGALWALYEGNPGHWSRVPTPITWQRCPASEFHIARAAATEAAAAEITQ